MKPILIILLLFTVNAFSQGNDSIKKEKSSEQAYQIRDDLQYVYKRPKFFSFITNIPKNYANLGKESVRKKNLKWLGLTLASTLILFPADEGMLDATKNIRNLGVTKDHDYGKILNHTDYPKNTSAAMYHLGHGNTSLLIGSGLLIVGGFKKDYRAIQTSSEILEGILTLGVLTQGIKRITGRESPELSTRPGGKWSSYPGWNEYMTNTGSYDAMPSGHVATLTSTVTILAKNYPNAKWIKPVGYSLIGVLSIEMMNSGVHWVSDYPLGFLIGYSVGAVVSDSRITKIKTDKYTGDPIGFNTNLTLKRLDGDNLIGVSISF
jgi:hypothetical protein